MSLASWLRGQRTRTPASRLVARQKAPSRRTVRPAVERLEDRLVPTSGFLDPTFGTIPTLPGRVVTDFGAFSAFAASAALQDDGKIVAVGEIGTPGGVDVGLARYNSDGSLDTFFGPDQPGKVVTDFGGSPDEALSVVLQADGKILVAGFTTRAGSQDFLLARYN